MEFYYKNKFEKLVHLVGFIIRTQEVLRGEINKKIKTCIGTAVLHALPNLLRTSTVTTNLKNGKNSMMLRIKNYFSTVIYQLYTISNASYKNYIS